MKRVFPWSVDMEPRCGAWSERAVHSGRGEP
jgi:hypothetical protein